jgi:phosphomevalonate kinase
MTSIIQKVSNNQNSNNSNYLTKQTMKKKSRIMNMNYMIQIQKEEQGIMLINLVWESRGEIRNQLKYSHKIHNLSEPKRSP